MVLFQHYGFSKYFHLWRTYRRIPYYSSSHLDQLQSRQNSTLGTGEVKCLVGLAALLVGILGGSVLQVDLDGVKKI